MKEEEVKRLMKEVILLNDSLESLKEWKAVSILMQDSWLLLKEVFKTLESNNKNYSFLLSKKQFASAREKLERKGYFSFKQFPDLVRGAVLTKNLEESIQVLDFLISNYNVTKWEVKKGTQENPYRGSFHLDIVLGELTCEVQVMPRATWAIKRVSHQFYKSGRAAEAADLWDEVETFSKPQLQKLGVQF